MTRVQTVIPQLRMTDAERSLRFYTEGLGFAEDWRHQFEPGLPLFVQLTRAGQTIFLSGHAGDGNVGGRNVDFNQHTVNVGLAVKF